METEKGEGGPVRAREGQAEAQWKRPQECWGQWPAGVRRVWAGQREPGRKPSSGAVNMEGL